MFIKLLQVHCKLSSVMCIYPFFLLSIHLFVCWLPFCCCQSGSGSHVEAWVVIVVRFVVNIIGGFWVGRYLWFWGCKHLLRGDAGISSVAVSLMRGLTSLLGAVHGPLLASWGCSRDLGDVINIGVIWKRHVWKSTSPLVLLRRDSCSAVECFASWI